MDEFDRAMRVSKETRKLDDIFVENQLHRDFSRAFTSILADLRLDIELADPKRRKCDGIVTGLPEVGWAKYPRRTWLQER